MKCAQCKTNKPWAWREFIYVYADTEEPESKNTIHKRFCCDACFVAFVNEVFQKGDAA